MTSEPIQPRSTADLAYGQDTDKNGDINTGAGGPSAGPKEATTRTDADQTPLLSHDKSLGYSGRWQDVQAEFVDEPQKAVRDADGLVAEVIQTLAATFADQRKDLEDQWSKGSEVSTEDLRQALMQYRSFFQRLLAA